MAEESDIVHRLRDWRNLHLARGGELFEAAADEIERLRSGVSGYTDGISADAESNRSYEQNDEKQGVADTTQATLTPDEREAISFFAAIHNEGYGLFATHTATLYKLLERTK